jgi:hypothetical protein
MSQPDYLFKVSIQTNSYAGNFERQMIAFVFNKLGESRVGEEYMNLSNIPFSFGEFYRGIELLSTEHWCKEARHIDFSTRLDNKQPFYDTVVCYSKNPCGGEELTNVRQRVLEFIERAELGSKKEKYDHKDPWRLPRHSPAFNQPLTELIEIRVERVQRPSL